MNPPLTRAQIAELRDQADTTAAMTRAIFAAMSHLGDSATAHVGPRGKVLIDTGFVFPQGAVGFIGDPDDQDTRSDLDVMLDYLADSHEEQMAAMIRGPLTKDSPLFPEMEAGSKAAVDQAVEDALTTGMGVTRTSVEAVSTHVEPADLLVAVREEHPETKNWATFLRIVGEVGGPKLGDQEMRRKLTADDHPRVRALLDAGLLPMQIALWMGIDAQAVGGFSAQHARMKGEHVAGGKLWTPQEDELIRQLWPAGEPLDKLVEKLPGRTIGAVRRHIVDLGVRRAVTDGEGPIQDRAPWTASEDYRLVTAYQWGDAPASIVESLQRPLHQIKARWAVLNPDRLKANQLEPLLAKLSATIDEEASDAAR